MSDEEYKAAIENGFQEIKNGNFVIVDPDGIFGKRSRILVPEAGGLRSDCLFGENGVQCTKK